LTKIGYHPCERSAANSVVLEPATPDGDISVYILTPQVVRDRYPFGGHYRIDVGRDGSIKNSRAFTNTCIAMAARPPQGAIPAGMFITHVLDGQPTEIHVWISLVANLPVYVGTIPSKEMWAVQDGSARLIQTLSSPAP
jgi:hypothetical protein